MNQHRRPTSLLVTFSLAIGGLALMVMMLYVVGNCVGRALFRMPKWLSRRISPITLLHRIHCAP